MRRMSVTFAVFALICLTACGGGAENPTHQPGGTHTPDATGGKSPDKGGDQSSTELGGADPHANAGSPETDAANGGHKENSLTKEALKLGDVMKKIGASATFIFNTLKAGPLHEKSYSIIAKNASRLDPLIDEAFSIAPPKLAGKNDFQTWLKALKGNAAAVNRAATADPRDPTELTRSIRKLGATCSACHNVYREEK